MMRLRAELRYLITYLHWLAVRVGYILRPYDMLADARRWFWQPQQRCKVIAAHWGTCRLNGSPHWCFDQSETVAALERSLSGRHRRWWFV